jgi:hypothetical protein
MALSPITQTLFNLPNGQPVANGSVKIHINKDCTSPTGLVGQKIKITVDLDANGVPITGPLFWPNSELTPLDTVYIFEVFNDALLRICGPIPVYVGSSSPPVSGFGSGFGTSFGS